MASETARTTHRVSGPALRRARYEFGNMTQEAAASHGHIGLRTLKLAEAGGKVSVATILRLAKLYGMQVGEIAPDLAAARRAEIFLQQQLLPSTVNADVRENIEKIQILDMEGNVEAAISKCANLLKRIEGDPQSGAELIAFVRVRLATALDNGGQHREALEALRNLGETSGGSKIGDEIRASINYHEGLALLHMRRWDEALKLIAPLARNRGMFQPAAWHQMGVACLGKYADTSASQFIEQADACFKAARKRWTREANYREGHSLRRLSQVAELRNDIPQSAKLLLDSLECFARYGCRRYADVVRQKLLSMIRTDR